jgi:hypothetical protein
MKTVQGQHRAISEFTEPTLISMWVEALYRNALGLSRTLDALGFTRREWSHPAHRVVGLACPRCGAEKTTADDAWVMMVATGGTFPNEPGGLRCAACSRGVTLPDLFDHFAPTKPKKMELLKKIKIMKPELRRFVIAEIDGERGVATSAAKALDGLVGPVHDCRARMVLIDAPSLAIATQLAGQMHDQLPWNENVPLHKDGSLAQVDWHGAPLSSLEQLQMQNTASLARVIGLKKLDQEVDAYRRQRTEEMGL